MWYMWPVSEPAGEIVSQSVDCFHVIHQKIIQEAKSDNYSQNNQTFLLCFTELFLLVKYAGAILAAKHWSILNEKYKVYYSCQKSWLRQVYLAGKRPPDSRDLTTYTI